VPREIAALPEEKDVDKSEPAIAARLQDVANKVSDIRAQRDRRRKELAAARDRYFATKAKFDEKQRLLDQVMAGAQGEGGK
jgi:hypothetical protein